MALGGIAVLALTGARSAVVSAQQQTSAPASLVFNGVTVVDVEQGQLRPDQRVVIVGNRIQAVAKAAAVPTPPGAEVIDARGQYLIPGLWNMHTHVPLPGDLGRIYRLYVLNGITGFRGAGDRSPIDTVRAWQRDILAGTRVGPPRQILSGAMLGTNEIGTREQPPCDERQTANPHFCIADTADARHLVDSLVAAGADMIKLWAVSRPMYAFIAAEARRLGRPFGGHAGGHGDSPSDPQGRDPDDRMGVLEASDLGARIIDHVIGEPSHCELPAGSVQQCQADVLRFRRNNTWFIPTLQYRVTDIGGGGAATTAILTRMDGVFSQFLAGERRPVGNWLRAPDSLRSTATPPREALLSIAERADLPLLAGTNLPGDAPADAFGLHVELASMVAEGLSPLHALQSATLNPAKAWHATDSLGTVAAGKLADLVLLDANPLEDITNTTTIRAVVANGRYYDRATLDRLLAEVHTDSVRSR